MAFPPYSLRQGLQSNPKLTNMTILISQLAMGVPYCYLMVSQGLPCPSDFDMGSDVPPACETSAVTTEPSPEPIYRTNSPLNTLFFFHLNVFYEHVLACVSCGGRGRAGAMVSMCMPEDNPWSQFPPLTFPGFQGVKLRGWGAGLHGKPLYSLSHLTTDPPLFLFILFDLWGGQAVVEFAV